MYLKVYYTKEEVYFKNTELHLLPREQKKTEKHKDVLRRREVLKQNIFFNFSNFLCH